MTLNRNILSSVLTFIAVLSVSFFFFWGTASASCTVSTIYVYGFPITYTTGDCSTTTASPTASLTTTPSTVASGGSSSLSWSSTNATSCTGTNFSTGNAKSGSATVKPTQTTTYTVTCSGGGKSATASRTITVSAPSSSSSGSSGFTGLGTDGMLFFGGGNIGGFNYSFGIPIAPTCNTPTLSSDKSSIIKGESAKLSWSLSTITVGTVTSGPSVSISNVGSVSPKQTTAYEMSGDVSVAPTQTTTYTATCSVTGGAGGAFTNTKNSAPVTVTVLEPVSGSCSVSPTSINTNGSATWTANPSGGDGIYTYSWSGTNGLSGTSKSVVKIYTSTGTKTGSVSITSAGSSKTISCSNSVTVANPAPQCSDGIDNDGDGKIDLVDFGCSTGTDTTESPNPQCSDGIDNDGDGKKDAADPGCGGGGGYSPNDTTESPDPVFPQCSDGLDNNLINGIDLADPACESASDNDEGAPPPAGVSLMVNRWLIISGQSVTLTWDAKNVKNNSCTVSGTNKQSWGPYSAGDGAVSSSPLTSETVFALSCTDFNDNAVSDSKTVRLVPFYKEF